LLTIAEIIENYLPSTQQPSNEKNFDTKTSLNFIRLACPHISLCWTFFLCHAHLLVLITPSLFHKDCDGNKQSTTHASNATMSTHGIKGKGIGFCTITFIHVSVWQGLCIK
jgi:hypothetical protein